MLIDARRKFAKATAKWLLHSRASKEDVAIRLRMFPDDHIKMIGEEARKLRGIPPKDTA